jgi:hypothetical protein
MGTLEFSVRGRVVTASHRAVVPKVVIFICAVAFGLVLASNVPPSELDCRPEQENGVMNVDGHGHQEDTEQPGNCRLIRRSLFGGTVVELFPARALLGAHLMFERHSGGAVGAGKKTKFRSTGNKRVRFEYVVHLNISTDDASATGDSPDGSSPEPAISSRSARGGIRTVPLLRYKYTPARATDIVCLLLPCKLGQ